MVEIMKTVAFWFIRDHRETYPHRIKCCVPYTHDSHRITNRPTKKPTTPLVHLSEELVDALLTVAVVTALNVVLKLASAPAAVGVRELEGPEEIACLLEIGGQRYGFRGRDLRRR